MVGKILAKVPKKILPKSLQMSPFNSMQKYAQGLSSPSEKLVALKLLAIEMMAGRLSKEIIFSAINDVIEACNGPPIDRFLVLDTIFKIGHRMIDFKLHETKKGMSIIERILETISNEEKIIRSISKRFSLDKYEDLWRRLHLGAEAYQAWRSQKISDKSERFGPEGSSQIH